MNKETPKGWNLVNFDSFFTVLPSKKYQVQKQDYLEKGLVPVVDQGQKLIIGYTDDVSKKFNKNNVIIFGDHTRIVKYIDFDFAVGADGTQILETKDGIDLKFGYYQLLNKNIPDTGYNRHFKYVKAEKYVIPPTLAEQQEIVQVLDTMNDIIRLRKECISHAQDLIPALFQEMFKQYIKQKDKHISIGSVTSDTKQINPLKFFETEFYYIDIASINNDTGIIETPKIININETPPSRARKLVQTNDVIISMTRPYLKGFSIIPKHLDGQIVSTGFSVLRSIPEKILPLYLFAYARTDMFVGQLIPKMKGANYPAVRDSDVRSVKIPLPPIELQEQFAEKVEKINSYIKEQQEELANAKQMFQSLLHHAFTGELTRHKFGGDANG